MTKVVEHRFDSPEGMSVTPGRLTALPWPDWSARVRSLEVDGVRADYVEFDPYELEIPPVRDRMDQPVRMMLSIILHGASTGEVDGRPLRLTAKQAALIDGRVPMRFRAVEPVRAVRLFVEEDHLPADALRCPGLPFATLRHTPLVLGCAGLITGLLQVGSPTIEPYDEAAFSKPLIALMAGLLDQALLEQTAAAVPEPGPRSRRAQVEAHIDRHLADPDLSVASIAAALGVHTRTIHLAFDDSDDTVAARIRARRVARAQMLLTARQEPPNVAALAASVGLTGAQLTRIFRAATSRTTHQWWHEHRRDPRRRP